jgi:hypothetical protein
LNEIWHLLNSQSNLDSSAEEIRLVSSSPTSPASVSTTSQTSPASVSTTSPTSPASVSTTSPTSPTSPASVSTASSPFHFSASNSSVVTSSTSNSFKNDIGLHIGKPVSDELKYELLTCHFEPDTGFLWPFKEYIKVVNGKTTKEKRYLKKDHFNEFKWLKYSPSQKGLFCVPCVLFTTSTARISSHGRLVEKPLDDYKHLLGTNGDLVLHQKTSYHLDSITKMESFLFIYSRRPIASVEVSLFKRIEKGNKLKSFNHSSYTNKNLSV